jgi:4-amino-4-deoxy-L-arabinose transferase-like glycosyltransferase
MVTAGVALWVTYLFGARAYGRWAGVIAALLLGLMPRVFYHAHLACFDIPIMTMWTLSVYVYWRATQERGFGWAIAAGLVYGLALMTKHNAWILPAVFVAHALVVHGRAILRNLAAGRVVLPAPLVAMATLGPLLFCAGWPWMWSDTAERVKEYVSFHLNHEYYNMEFLGRNYGAAPSPRSYMPVMILATVPAVTLALFGLGAFDRLRVLVLRILEWGRVTLARSRRRVPASLFDSTALGLSGLEPHVPKDKAATDVLIFLACATALAPWVLSTKYPIFGGTKHWLPAYPFLAILAGRGFVIALSALRRTWPGLVGWIRPATEIGLAFAVTIGPLVITVHSHPFGLSSYVPLVGGTAGGADLGLNRQFWGFTTQGVGPYLEKNAPRHASVFIHDTAWESWQQMQAEDRIRNDLRGVNSPSEADFALVHHELHMNEIDYEIWVAYGNDAPAYVLTHDEVPIVSVYRRR